MLEDFTEEIKSVPFVRILLPFLTGIIFSRFISLNLILPGILLFFSFVLLFYIWKKKKISYKYSLRWIFGLVINIFLFFSGILYLKVFESRPYFQNVNENTVAIIADVTEIPEEREKTYKLILKATASISGDSINKTTGKLLGYISKDSLSAKIRIGDRLILKNNFREITNNNNPLEFDYREYLWNQGIRRQAFIQKDQWSLISKNNGNPVLLFAGSLRQKLLDLFTKFKLEGDEFAVASALTLGYKAALDEDIRRSYSSSGAMHVLAVSGLHVGIIFFVLNYLLLFLTKLKWGIVIRAVILLFCLWFYAILTGLSPSVMRAATMFSFIIVGFALKRPANIYNTLAASAFFLILIDPNIIWAVGFQLSYSAVIGIVFFQPRLYKLIYVKNKLTDKIWTLTCVSAGAQLGTFPLSLYYFNQFPNLFFITNLFVIPLATVILYSGILLFVFSFYSPFATILAFVLKWLVWFLNTLVKLIEALPFSHTKGVFISFEQVPLFYLLVILLSLYFIRKHVVSLKVSMITIIVLLVFWSYTSIEASFSKQLIVFNVNNQLAVNYLGNNQNLVITSDKTPEIIRQIEYSANNSWVRYNSKRPVFMQNYDSLPDDFGKEIFQHNHFWNFSGKTMVIIESAFLKLAKPDAPVNVDFVILSGKEYMSPARILEYVNPGSIIISSSVPFWFVKRYEEALSEMDIKYHIVSSQGAFVYRFS